MKPATLDATSTSASRVRPRSRNGREPLDLYLDRAGRHPRLSAEQERMRLLELVELRRHRWRIALSQPGNRAAVLARVEAGLESALRADEELREPLGPDTVPIVRTEGTAEAKVLSPFDRSIDLLAVELEVLDVDGVLIDAITENPPTEGLDATTADEYGRELRHASTAYVQARNRFVCANLRLVLNVAARYSKRWMSLADRVQEGNLGLIKAVERFDPDRGTRFSTYAVWWIRHAVTRALMNRGRTVRVPAHLHMIFTKVRRARTCIEGQLGRPATLAELSNETGVPVDKIEAAVSAMELRSVSLEGTRDDEGGTWADRLGEPAPQMAIDSALDERRGEHIALQALDRLSPRERDILERRFELGGRGRMTLEELGRLHSVSRERVRQLQNRALRALRNEVESSPLSGLALA